MREVNEAIGETANQSHGGVRGTQITLLARHYALKDSFAPSCHPMDFSIIEGFLPGKSLIAKATISNDTILYYQRIDKYMTPCGPHTDTSPRKEHGWICKNLAA